jgi:hypothetical protein
MTLTRNVKKIQFSLQGIDMPWPDKPSKEFLQVVNGGGAKYFGLFEDNTPIYQNWFGQFPSNEFLENFILE